MVSDRAMKNVLAVLSTGELHHQADIVRKTGYTTEFVKKLIATLLEMGNIERVVYEKPIPSGRANGWYRVAYRKKVFK